VEHPAVRNFALISGIPVPVGDNANKGVEKMSIKRPTCEIAGEKSEKMSKSADNILAVTIFCQQLNY